MTNNVNSREIALEILNNVDNSGSYSNIEISNMINEKNLKIEDKNLISKMVYGVIENRIFIDYCIENLSTTKLKKINYKILNVLRLGIYQMKFLTKIPDSAAVNESVKLSKKINYKSSGFVNAILRSFIRNEKKVQLPSKEAEPLNFLSIKYSHPKWLVKRWIDEYGVKFTEELLIANNSEPNLSIRTNTLKISRAELIDKLFIEGIEAIKSDKTEDGIVIEKIKIGNIKEIESYKEGLFQVQDESSMMVAEILDVYPGMTVIDVCAAPGGKTTHIAQKMNNEGSIFAFDIYDHKVNLIRENANRLGIKIIEESIQDASIYNEKFANLGDRVLVDVPCTGFGIIRRKPEIKFNKSFKDIENLNLLQLKILNNASSYLKTGGILLYSTCSIEILEDENIIELFLQDNKNFSKVQNGTFKFFPNQNGMDGFFISKLIKNI